MKASMDTREKLIGNKEKMNKQDSQLNRIKGTAEQSYGLMVDTN